MRNEQDNTRDETMTNDAKKVEVGTRIFNRGDMANQEHFGTVVKFIPATRLGPEEVKILPDSGAGLQPYTYTLAHVYHVDSGNGSTRVVTKTAYDELRKQQIESLRASVKNARVEFGDPRITRLLQVWHEQFRETFERNYKNLDYDSPPYAKTAKDRRKYVALDDGDSGRYLLEKATGIVWGIKAYGVIHRGKRMGHIDAIIEKWS